MIERDVEEIHMQSVSEGREIRSIVSIRVVYSFLAPSFERAPWLKRRIFRLHAKQPFTQESYEPRTNF
jgi:hypothetical protein